MDKNRVQLCIIMKDGAISIPFLTLRGVDDYTRYYEDNIDAFFRSSTYCLLSIEEKRNIAQLKKVRDAIVDQAKEIKRQIDRKVVPKNSSI